MDRITKRGRWWLTKFERELNDAISALQRLSETVEKIKSLMPEDFEDQRFDSVLRHVAACRWDLNKQRRQVERAIIRGGKSLEPMFVVPTKPLLLNSKQQTI